MSRLYAAMIALGFAIGTAWPAYAAPKLDPNEITEAHYVNFTPILMTVVQERQIRGLVQLEVTIMLKDPNEWEEIVSLRARLQDRLVQAVGGMTRGAIRVDRPLNVPLITKVLQRQIDGALGPDRASVLIVDASTRSQ